LKHYFYPWPIIIGDLVDRYDHGRKDNKGPEEKEEEEEGIVFM